MITKINRIIFAICMMGGLTSCSDFLEIEPQNEIILEKFVCRKKLSSSA